MKKLKIISMLLVLVIFTGCNNQSLESNIPSGISIQSENPLKENEVVQLTVTTPYYGTYDETVIASWESYINNEFDVDVDLVTYGNAYETFEATSILYLLNNESVSGLVYIPNTAISSLSSLIAEGKILPLNNMLSENEVYKELPQEMTSLHTDNEGNVYAIPFGYELTFGSRYYNKEWLSATGLDIPHDLNNLLEVASAFYQKNSESVFASSYQNFFISEYVDIFNANGCYLTVNDTSRKASSIAYDPEYTSYEDCMLKPEMTNTLLYLKNMIDKGYIDITTNSAVNDKVAGSKYSANAQYFSSDKYCSSQFLSGTKEFNNLPIFINKNTGFYVLAKNTDNPELVINKFIDVFYGNPYAHFAGEYGIPGDYYNFTNNSVMLNRTEIMMKDYFLQPIVGEFEKFSGSNVTYDFTNVDSIKQETDRYSNFKREVYDNVNNLINQKHAFFVSPLNIKSEITMVNSGPTATLINQFSAAVQVMASSDISIEEIISEYKNTMKMNGGQEYIDRLNESIGVETSLIY